MITGEAVNAAEWHQAEMPQTWMSLIFEIREEVKDRGAVACEKPCLNFVAPHLMVGCGKRTDCEKKECQAEGVVFIPFTHFM